MTTKGALFTLRKERFAWLPQEGMKAVRDLLIEIDVDFDAWRVIRIFNKDDVRVYVYCWVAGERVGAEYTFEVQVVPQVLTEYYANEKRKSALNAKAKNSKGG